MLFRKGTWKNNLYVHFKYNLLHSRIFAALVHWEISKKNGNWRQNVPNSCTVHRVFIILKPILKSFSIHTFLLWKTCWSTGFVADHSSGRPGFNSPSKLRLFSPFALILLNKVMENKSFFSISCQSTKTVMLLPHTDMIIEQCPTEFCLVHWKKKLKLISTEGWLTYIQLCSYCLLSQMVWIVHNFLLSILA